jgi:NAD(P)-dependent dehydrogenase (short-subunit alcohol dehydrogenase family)
MTDWRKLFSLEDRVALVIGGGSGIGRAGAEASAAEIAGPIVFLGNPA